MKSSAPILPLPESCAKYVSLCLDEQATGLDLVALLSVDPEMAERFIRLASGECYGSGSVNDLARAVVRVGFSFARRWVALSSLGGALAASTGRDLAADPFWRRAMCRAMAADSLEDFFVPRGPGEAGVVAFLWECGELRLGRDAERKAVLAESARMIRAWKLPESAWGAVAAAASGEPGAASPLPVRIYHVSDHFAEICFGERTGIKEFLDTASRLFDAPLELIEDVVIGSLDRLRHVADRIVQTDDVRKALLDLFSKASVVFRELLPEAAAGGGQAAEGPLPSLATLDMTSARQTMEAMAHELRNPLMVVGGFARKLAASLGEDTREREYAEVILEEGARIEELFKELEARSRPAS